MIELAYTKLRENRQWVQAKRALLIFIFFFTGLSAQNKHLAKFWHVVEGKIIQCDLCPNQCILQPGQRGLCGARININGKLYSLVYGVPCALHIDPIEKKPFFHVYPGAKAYSIATLGCNMRCKFCQNWQISQALPQDNPNYFVSPDEIVKSAIAHDCEFVVFTYTEPTVFYEYMLDIAKLAKENGLRTGWHTCGYINPEPLKKLLKYIDATNVDLKGFTQSFYKKMGLGRLEDVLRTIKIIHNEGKWLEITCLIIPGANDNLDTIRAMCEWILENLGPDVPVHFSRFYPAHRLRNLPPTPIETLEKARQIALNTGLHYVYIGNVVGHPAEDTYCPHCGKNLIDRYGYIIISNNVRNGRCKFCGQTISGLWRK